MAGNTGETPDDMNEEEIERLTLGEPVFDRDGNRLGTIRGFDTAGFYATMREGYEAMSIEHARSGGEFGDSS
jgi:hypothetical protein